MSTVSRRQTLFDSTTPLSAGMSTNVEKDGFHAACELCTLSTKKRSQRCKSETMSIRDLPMEVWSRVATFLPFESLLDTFWSLTNVRVLPDTRTNASNAFLQFCSGVAAEQALSQQEEVYDVPQDMREALTDMGFDADQIEFAIQLCEGREEAVVDYLLNRAAEG